MSKLEVSVQGAAFNAGTKGELDLNHPIDTVLVPVGTIEARIRDLNIEKENKNEKIR